MLCVLDVDTSDQEAAANAVVTLINVAVDMARGQKVPPLYRSGVRYIRQSKDACAMRLPSDVHKRGGGDCKQLVIWRLAELRNAGESGATARIVWLPEKQGFRAHALIRRANGDIEDPSVELGMTP